MKIDLVDEFNSEQILEKVKELFPDSNPTITPAKMVIKGSGDGEIKGAKLDLGMNISGQEEKARIEILIKQAIFDLPPSKTDAELKKDRLLEEALFRPEFVYIISLIDDLEKDIKELKKETNEEIKPDEKKQDKTPVEGNNI